MRDSGALTELLLTRLKNVEVPIARWLILHKPLAEGKRSFPPDHKNRDSRDGAMRRPL